VLSRWAVDERGLKLERWGRWPFGPLVLSMGSRGCANGILPDPDKTTRYYGVFRTCGWIRASSNSMPSVAKILTPRACRPAGSAKHRPIRSSLPRNSSASTSTPAQHTDLTQKHNRKLFRSHGKSASRCAPLPATSSAFHSEENLQPGIVRYSA
jgi:hypothetical protein